MQQQTRAAAGTTPPGALPGTTVPTTYTALQEQQKVDRRDPHWRVSFIGPFLWWIGSILWIVAAGVMLSDASRWSTAGLPGLPTADLGDDGIQAGAIISIVGSAFWVLAALISVLSAAGEARSVRQSLNMNKNPPIVRLLVRSAVLLLIGSIVILIGSAVFTAQTFGTASAGSILWLIGFFINMIGSLLAFSVALMVLAFAPVMNDMVMRYRAWHGLIAALGTAIGWVFMCLGSILFILIRPPGVWLIGSLLFLVGSSMLTLAYFHHMTTVWGHFVPILALTCASGFLHTEGNVAVPAGATAVGIAKTGSDYQGAGYQGEQKPMVPLHPAGTAGAAGMLPMAATTTAPGATQVGATATAIAA